MVLVFALYGAFLATRRVKPVRTIAPVWCGLDKLQLGDKPDVTIDRSNLTTQEMLTCYFASPAASNAFFNQATSSRSTAFAD